MDINKSIRFTSSNQNDITINPSLNESCHENDAYLFTPITRENLHSHDKINQTIPLNLYYIHLKKHKLDLYAHIHNRSITPFRSDRKDEPISFECFGEEINRKIATWTQDFLYVLADKIRTQIQMNFINSGTKCSLSLNSANYLLYFNLDGKRTYRPIEFPRLISNWTEPSCADEIASKVIWKIAYPRLPCYSSFDGELGEDRAFLTCCADMSTGKNRLMTTPQTEFTLLNEKWFSIHYFQNRHYCLVNLNLTPFAKGGQRKVHYAYLNHSESDIGAVSIRKVKNQFSPFSSPEYLLTKKILSSPPDEVNQLIKIYAQFFFNQDELNYSQVMKYYYQGDLGEYIVNKTRVFFSDEELISVILQCAEGVTQLHNLGFWHRDIKPKNFFSTYRSPQMKAPNNIEVVLGDFGLTYPRNQSVCKKVGTTCYIAPEILTSSEYSDAADVYSLGITLAEVVFRSRLIPKEMAKAEKILTFKSACESKNISSTLEAAISHGNLNTSSHQNRLIVEHLIKLCKSCTQYRPENRPSLRDIVSKIRSIALEWNELNPKLP